MPWFDEPANREHVERLRALLSDGDGRIVLFLGAGLSFGASRRGRKSLAEQDLWGRSGGRTEDGDKHDPDAPEVIVNDDQEPFPTWGRLKSRMRVKLANIPSQDQAALNRFFRASDPLDCAQLFRNIIGEANYFDFLRLQFSPPSPVDYWITPSHQELVALELPLLFTTNYDDLIERAYVHHGRTLATSRTADEFVGQLAARPMSHLVKVHGSIDQVSTVVLTRDDYSRARRNRARIYDQLRYGVEGATHLFVGFSLSDPNINVLLDDARLQTGGALPPSYTVQGRYDPVMDAYYRSLGVNVIWIGTWNYLPSFLRAVNPRFELETATPGGFDI